MRACVCVIAGGCGLVTATTGAPVRSCLTHRGNVLREIARLRAPRMCGLITRGSVNARP